MNASRDRLDEEDLDLDGEDDEDAQKDKYMTFRIGGEDYGIPIAHVTEIVGMQRITHVPDMPVYLRGVINLRGQVIPVMDVRARFGMDARAYDDRTCVVVVNLDDATPVGLIVDTVNEVISIPAAQVSPPPRMYGGAAARYLSGIGRAGEHVKILLDVERLLFDHEREQIREWQAGASAPSPALETAVTQGKE